MSKYLKLTAKAIVLLVAALNFQSCIETSTNYVPADLKSNLRASAYPLITIDPYTSVWSFDDELYASPTRHWTGCNHPLVGALRVDGAVYRFMGADREKFDTLLPCAISERWEAKYTEKKPSDNWIDITFNDAAWTAGKAAFGTDDKNLISTPWTSKDIWVRRYFKLAKDDLDQNLFLVFSHDDIFELYINGIKLVSTPYSWRENVVIPLTEEVKKSLREGNNVIAAHCHNQTGGSLVDFGLLCRVDTGTHFAQTAKQTSVSALPTQTIYTFDCGPVELELIFTAPFLMNNLDKLSSPFNYITWQARSKDGQKHDAQIYFNTTAELAVEDVLQPVAYDRVEKGPIAFLKAGTVEQPVLKKSGDVLRIDWGHLYLGTKLPATLALGDYFEAQRSFAEQGTLLASADPKTLQPDMRKQLVALSFCSNLGRLGDDRQSGYLLLGYDDQYSIQYFGENLRPYWSKNGTVDIYQAFKQGIVDYEKTMKECLFFNERMMTDAAHSGGVPYAELCALVYRQSIAAHKLVNDKNGTLLFFSKENHSNGSIGTVDITYPSAPLYLVYNPELLKGMLNPIFYYCESGKWTNPFAPHDVGTYPLANGQTYGGNMPVEECGNMLILTTAIACVEGNADYAKQHWLILKQWADYLIEKGMNPESQLCTDDFAGHLGQNVNLSVKAIMGIAGYAQMADMLGFTEESNLYMQEARAMAANWQTLAADGDHYTLTFDQKGTWSQKYNLVWDKLFKTALFDPEIVKTEVEYYLTKQNDFGLPLDSRKTYSKSDWIIWSACLTDDPAKFEALVMPVYKYVNETPNRIPQSDWYETIDGSTVGFRARSVVGGYFMPMLRDKMD